MAANILLDDRYARNKTTIQPSDQKKLANSAVCVVGCGGLGGSVIEGLARVGVGTLTVVDCDAFEPSNLNRQLLSNEMNIGEPKAIAAKNRVSIINSSVRGAVMLERFTAETGNKIVHGHDVVVDALDNIPSRMDLEKVCEEEGIPIIHGAIGGWNGQLAVIKPGERLLHKLYDVDWNGDLTRIDVCSTEEKRMGNPSFTPMVLAGMEVAETIKLLIEKETPIEGKIMMVDLLNHQYEIISI